MRIKSVVIVERGDDAAGRAAARGVANGDLTKLMEAIYVDTNAVSRELDIFNAHAQILARFAPGAVLDGVSGMRAAPMRLAGPDGRPVFPGWLFATHQNGTANKSISLDGLEIRSLPGVGVLEGDIPYLGIHLPSPARKMLANLKPSRSRNGPPRTMGRGSVETYLDQLLLKEGPEALAKLLEHARRITPDLQAENELAVLEELIEAMTSDKEIVFQSPALTEKFKNSDPYDLMCVNRLKNLALELQGRAIVIPDPHTSHADRECVAFIESYFTNYIEGTKFLIDKAKSIVFGGMEPDGRHKDSRDIVEIYNQAFEFARQSGKIAKGDSVATSAGEFMDELRDRHSRMMKARPELNPGQFKDEPNMAGNHVFVMPNLVRGTLREGVAMLREMDNPFIRGLFAHAMTVLVHPFADGNGRISRLMMTKELVAGGESRIIVPTIYRNDYIGGMRALTRPEGADAAPFVRSMKYCQEVTSKIAIPDLTQTIERWASTNAFLEDEKNARLELPNDHPVEWRNFIPAPAEYFRAIDDAICDASMSL